MKISFIPWMVGALIGALLSGSWSFFIATGITMLVLVFTKQIKLI
jgi:hypothetical protein